MGNLEPYKDRRVGDDRIAMVGNITLEALSAFSFLPNDVEDLVNELGTFGVIYETRVR